MIKEDDEREEFKKEALELILSIYLQRENDEDVKFIHENVKSSTEFAKNISSDIKIGLNKENVQKNKVMYGKNSKRALRTYKFTNILKRVLRLHNLLIFTICIIQMIFGELVDNREIYMDAVYAMILLGFFMLIRLVTIYLNEKKKSDESYDKNKNEKYRVLREGNFVEISETKIVVGDIIELDYKEKVPASGILITNKEIAMNEEIYGRKTQRKMSLEKCLSYTNKLSLLELRIDSEKHTLPSPIILRGTEQIFGSSYKILVLAVDEEILLEKFVAPRDSTFVSNIIRDWFEKLEEKIEKIMRIISVVYLILFISLFGLKEFLERKRLSAETFLTDLFSVLLMSILSFSVFDAKCLRLFVETQVISYTENLNDPKEVDKYLTVEQIYISENNIVKYDEIQVCEIGLPDKENSINYEDLNILTLTTKDKIEEVLEGIGLKSKKKDEENNPSLKIKEDSTLNEIDRPFNQIVHINSVDQKVFTVLYKEGKNECDVELERQSNIEQKLKKKDKEKQSTFLNTASEENASNISLNRVSPLDEDNPFKKPNKRRVIKKELAEPKQRNSDINSNEENLKGYLGDFCTFKANNIVEGIAQLSNEESRTYYYQKYSIFRLKRIKSVWVSGNELEMNKERIEKLKRLARNIRGIDNLTPYLIGYSYGAYNKECMTVLVSIIGVKINYENEIIKRMKELEEMGIKSIVLIGKRDEDDKGDPENGLLASKITNDFREEEDYGKILSSEYISRGWISHESEEIIDFPTLKESCGIIRCESCYLSKCDCKNRIEEISEPQNFISHLDNTKIIHTIDSEADLKYLKIGSEQIRNSVLTITKYKSNTIKILDDVKRGYYLSNILEKGLNVWYGFMFVSAICFYPLSLVSFGGVFASGDISLWILFIQSLPAIGNMHIEIFSKENVENQSRRNKVLYSKKSTFSVVLLCLISTIFAIFFYITPNSVMQESYANIAADIQEKSGMIFDRDCHYKYSIFLSDEFNKIECIPPSEDQKIYDRSSIPQFIYSQNVNFIFAYVCLNMIIFFISNFRNFSKPRVLAVYVSMFAVYFIVIYVEQEIIHGRYDGLTPGQLAIVVSMSIITNLLIQCIAYFSNYSCAVCDTEEFQSILSFEESIEDHYSTKLKRYNTFQTDTYILN